MFENEERKRSNGLSTISTLTIEEENFIRKYVNQQYFNVNTFISYLNNHDYIGLEIFEESLLSNNEVGWTYLNYLKLTRRDLFIKRIPLYFYDLDCEIGDLTLTKLFDEYKLYIEGNAMSGPKMAWALDESIEQAEYNSFDFEPLYKILDEIIHDIKVPIHLVLDYMRRQCGESFKYFVFDVWYKYAKIVPNLNENNVFPKNILYAYNIELEKQGKSPIIYYPLVDSEGNFFCTKIGNELLIGGLFPFDDKGKIISRWIGVWCENDVNPTQKDLAETGKHNHQIAKRDKSGPILRVTLKIKLGPDSLVFAAKHIVVGHNMFGEEQTTDLWEQIYVGPKKMEFNYQTISEKRESMNLSLKQVSEATNINVRTLQRIENNESTPDGLNLIKLMDYLGIKNYDSLIIHEKIYDPGFNKFKTGKKPSEFIAKEK